MAKPTKKLEDIKKKFASRIRSTHKYPHHIRYPDDLKRSVIKLAGTTDITKYRISKELGINYSLVHTWCREAA